MNRILGLLTSFTILLSIALQAASDDDMQSVMMRYSRYPVTQHNNLGNLVLSGDIIIQWEYDHTHSRKGRMRGSGAYKLHDRNDAIPTSTYTAQVDLVLDYTNDPTYSKIQLESLTNSGIITHARAKKERKKKEIMTGSGMARNIQLLQAYMGYKFIDTEAVTCSLDVGRRRLFDLFDSKIQFDNIFDGLLFSYRKTTLMGEFQTHVAPFVIDANVNQLGLVGDLQLLAIGGSTVDMKYSLISWNKRGYNRYHKRHALGTRFVNSQLLLVHGLPDMFGQDPSIYLAGLHNHAATANHFTHHKKAANAFYGGITIGQVKRKNDWSLDLNYQYVQAQAIPEGDVSGIGRDNPLCISFYDHNFAGYSNYKGFEATYVYGLTDTISLTAQLARVTAAQRRIGGYFHSTNLTLSTTFSF